MGAFWRSEPDRLLEITWLNEVGTHGVETVLRVEIAPETGGTRLRLTHSGFRDETTSDEHGEAWEQLLPGPPGSDAGPIRRERDVTQTNFPKE